ncbi:MAG: ATP-binding protein [Chthoniobacterales bacterium]
MQSDKILAGLLRALAEQSAKTLDRDLVFIERHTTSFAREHERLFDGGDHRPSGEQPEFREAPDGSGSLYQANGNEGPGFVVFEESVPRMGEEEWRLAVGSASLGSLYRTAVEAVPFVVAAYFNTHKPVDTNRYYPRMERPWEVFPVEVNMSRFNFFYLADARHNPERKTVWTGVYLDPAGQGWMLSCIAPVYCRDTLKGVVGLDVTFPELVKGIRNLSLPWVSAMLVAPDGMILAATEEARRMAGLPELPDYSYAAPVNNERIDPEELRLEGIRDANLRKALQVFFASDESFREVRSANGALMLAQSVVPSTGWRLCLLVRRAELLAEFDRLAGRESELQSELEAKDTELAYSRWLFSLASGYLHNVGNAVTGLGSPLIDLKSVLKYSPQYPAIFERIRQGGPGAGATLKRFEEVLVGEIVPTLSGVADSIAEIQEAIRVSIRHQQDGFRSAVRQASEQIDLSGLLENMCELFEKHHPDIARAIAPGVTVRSFRIQLWQGLDNVIRNAIQASAPVQRIGVSCQPTGHGARVVVTDCGQGVAPGHLDRVMKAGFTTKGHSGNGLGLHSFAVFLSATGGDLRLESEGAGKGTTVTADIRNAD